MSRLLGYTSFIYIHVHITEVCVCVCVCVYIYKYDVIKKNLPYGYALSKDFRAVVKICFA